MPVSGDQLHQIIAALLSAYPSEGDLTMMVRIHMGESLSAITGGSNQRERIFHLVEWAETTGQLNRLIDAAVRGNSRNPDLLELVRIMEISAKNSLPQRQIDLGQTPTLRRNTPFIGTIPFDASTADLFFGRAQEADSIVHSLEQSRILIINGRSGSGKTSLIRAGLIPRLRALGHRVIYASIIDNPHADIIRAIENSLSSPPTASSLDIVVALNLHQNKAHDARIDLIIDQMERCFTLSAGADERNKLWRDIARIISDESNPEVRLVLAIRADWLYAFQTANPLAETYPLFAFIRLVEPLSISQAREAIEGPLTAYGVSCESDVLDQIITDLKDPSEHVNPPQLQIVGQALYEHIQQKRDEEGRQTLSLADYDALEGTSTILRQHLLKVIGLLGPRQGTCWQVLLKLIDNNNRISRSEDELRGSISDTV